VQILNVNPLNDGTRSGTVDNLAALLSFIEAATEDSEICDPGLHQAIKIASATARKLKKFEAEKELSENLYK
jgi:hypothetical protein